MTDFKQGDRVQTPNLGKGVVVATGGSGCKIGFDEPDLKYHVIQLGFIEPIPHSPSPETLPQAHREILLALHEKRTTEGQHEAHDKLREYGYITAENKLTPYGDYVMRRWVEAGKPVVEVEAATVADAQESTTTPDTQSSKAALDDFFDGKYATTPRSLLDDSEGLTEEETSFIGVMEKLMQATDPEAFEEYQAILTKTDEPERPGDNLFFEQDIAKELETLKAQNAELEAEIERLRDANTKFAENDKTRMAEIREMQNENMELRGRVEKQAQELVNMRQTHLTLQPVETHGSARILSEVITKIDDEPGILRQMFLPELKQPKPLVASEPAFQIIGLYEHLTFEQMLEEEDATVPDLISAQQRGVAAEFSETFKRAYVTGGINVAND